MNYNDKKFLTIKEFAVRPDGKVAYKCLVSDEKEQCTCLYYQRNSPTDPNFRCKHLMAILRCHS